jgi:glycosyltransferase involved in cell wall biosynthesis
MGGARVTAQGPGEPGRVALLLNNPFVADSRSWKTARSLAEAGWAVTVVARRGDGLPERETRDGFAVVRVDQPRPLAWMPAPRLPEAATGEPVPGETGRAANPPTVSRVRAGARAVRAAVVDVAGRGIQAIRYLRLAGQWADRIGAVVPGADIWQSEGLITLPVALALRSRRGGRVVYDVRDLHVESSRFARLPGPWRRLLARRERAWARSADAVITANEPYAAVLLESLGVRATVVHNGPLAPAPEGGAAEVAAVPIRDRLGLPASTRIVLYLGNVAPGRGVEQLCRAIAEVPAAVLAVIGPGGSFRDRLIAEAAVLPAADRIHFLPAVAPDEIPGWTAAADVAAMPIQPTTLNHRLTTPTRLFDALGAGIPVVASDLPGMAAIVRETGAGVLCDPTDPGSIAAAIRAVLDAPPERRRELREAALAAARGPYAWERQVARLLEVYRGLSR